MTEQPKNPITWLVNPYGIVLIANGFHNLDNLDTVEIQEIFEIPTRIITEDNEISQFFASLGYRPTLDDNNNILYYLMSNEWGNDSI